MNTIDSKTSGLIFLQRCACVFFVLGLCGPINAQNSPPPATTKVVNKSAENCDKNCKETPSNLDFSPPPVPGFMLERPSKPLSLDEMVQQAKDAVLRSQKSAGTPPPKAPIVKSLD